MLSAINKVFNMAIGFFQENNPNGSSKRLIIIASHAAAIFVSIYAMVTQKPISESE